MFEKLLIPLDGSEVAESILPYATELARRCGSHVTLLEAVESIEEAIAMIEPSEPAVAVPGTVDALVEGVESEHTAAEQYLSRVATKLGDEGIQADTAVVEGGPGQAIVEAAEQRGCDVIAISSHGRGGIERLLMGSVADHVIRHARMPVLVLHYHEPKGHKDAGL